VALPAAQVPRGEDLDAVHESQREYEEQLPDRVRDADRAQLDDADAGEEERIDDVEHDLAHLREHDRQRDAPQQAGQAM
jgi:hypothetical protein